MCFYFQLSADAQTLENRFQRKFHETAIFKSKSWINAFEHPLIPIVLPNQYNFEFFEWGLIPFWAKDTSIQKSTLNARMETLTEKPAFKNIISNRCLIPSTGFYEWQWLDPKGKEKQRYLIQSSKQSIFCFAGLTSQWSDLSTGKKRNTFTLLTTQANETMSEIHNTKQRMPLILNEKDENNWLLGYDFKSYAFPYRYDLVAKKF